MEISSEGGRKRGKLALCGAAVAFCLLLAMGAPAAAAKVVRVGSWDELRAAVGDPNSGDVIEVTGDIDRSLATDKTQIEISRSLTIRGVGMSPVTIDGKTDEQGGPDASNNTRLFDVEGDEADSVTVKFENLVLTGGKVKVTGDYYAYGGAVLGTGGTALTFINCVIEGNEASGKQAYGGGVYAEGDATFTSCDVSGNTATGEGGSAQGGGVHLADVLGTVTRTFTNCTVSGNVVSGTANVFGGGVCSHQNVTFENCTVSGNVVSGDAAGSYHLEGGGVYVFKKGTFTNCTVSGNTVTGEASTVAGGGIWVQTNSSLEMTNCTVADNKVEATGDATPSGGGIRGSAVNGVTLVNCTVTGNTVKKTRAPIMARAAVFMLILIQRTRMPS